MIETSRLGLPLLAAGQTQKELVHNEALSLIDVAVQASVESADLSQPAEAPLVGQCWIVAPAGTGAWIGRDGDLAAWTDAGWIFLPPAPGWRVWVEDRGHMLRFDGAAWRDAPVRADGYYVDGTRVVAQRQAGIADPIGGAIQDGEARAALATVLAVLRAHGLIAT